MFVVTAAVGGLLIIFDRRTVRSEVLSDIGSVGDTSMVSSVAVIVVVELSEDESSILPPTLSKFSSSSSKYSINFSVVLAFLTFLMIFFAALGGRVCLVNGTFDETTLKELFLFSTPIDVELTFDSLSNDKVLKTDVKFSTFKLSVAKLFIAEDFVTFKTL